MSNSNEQLNLPLLFHPRLVVVPHGETRSETFERDIVGTLRCAENHNGYFLALVPIDGLDSDKLIGLLYRNSELKNQIEDGFLDDFWNSFQKVAVLVKIVGNLMTGPIVRLKFTVTERINLTNIKIVDGQLFAEGLIASDSNFEVKDYLSYVRRLKEVFTNFRLNPTSIDTMVGEYGADAGLDHCALQFVNSVSEHARIIVAINVVDRLKAMLEVFEIRKTYGELDRKIEENVKKSINDSQKEYYLREKMRAIQEELGEKAKRDTDVENLREQIKNKKLPARMEEIALKELNRYITTSSNSAECGVIRSYLDFILSLPWDKYSADTNDLKVAEAELDKDHYGLTKVKNRILEYLAVKIMTGKNPQTILCLVGPPGVGKTSLARSIATSLNRNFVKQALGGVRDESEIRGHRRTYIGALPGRILQAMAKSGTSNPVFLLDEVDKMSSDYKGDPTSAMLEVLDAEQNYIFSDHYLEEPYDLSKVLFICTANYLENIPAPLRDRLEIVEVSSYTEYEKFEIAKRHLLNKQLQRHGLEPDAFSISDQAIYKIIQSYTREAGVRELERHLGTIIRKSVKKLLLDKEPSINVTVDNIEDFLGKPRYLYGQIDKDDQVGVVTGLAYTQYGGDTLPVEVTYYPGKGGLVLTGQLGDVMKESAQAALSYVKSSTAQYNIDPEIFQKNDIHIHVPEGAVPKDGPSAGITMATALISALSSTKVNHLVGMTGEINLRGRVMPIGGLREKSIAAHRMGLKTILIPKENIRDLDEIPESVKSGLTIIPVSSIEEVIGYAFIKANYQ